MFGRGLDQARAGLADRFEADGDDWLFRATPTAVPVRVSQRERDKAIADVVRGCLWLSWGMLVGMIGAVGLVVVLAGDKSDGRVDWWLYASMALVISIFGLGWWRVWTMPARRFNRRAPAGVARSRAEARDRHFERLGWGQILIGGIVAIGISASRVFDRDEPTASHWFFGLLGAGAIVVLTITAWRKWRHERAHDA